MHVAATGTPPVPRKKPYGMGLECKPHFYLHDQRSGPYTLSQSAEYLREPIKRKPKPLRHKRTKKVSPLTRIAEQLPMKLKKVPTAVLVKR